MHTILVTGANRGIGLELTKQYLEDGWKVIACTRVPAAAEKLNQLAHSYPDSLSIVALDVNNPEQIKQVAAQLADQPIDILFNNAGVWEPANQSLGTITQESFIDILKTNTIAPLLITQAFLDNVRNSDRKIIANMSSGLGSITHDTEGGNHLYRASKSAINALTRSLANDLRPMNIIVVVFNPGWVKTDMGGPNAPTTPSESVQGLRRVLASLTPQSSGHFFRFDGTPMPW
jgi:NAD(P)-dependent dehydrogenase (short-subunit alcohol dehydrogenase family)